MAPRLTADYAIRTFTPFTMNVNGQSNEMLNIYMLSASDDIIINFIIIIFTCWPDVQLCLIIAHVIIAHVHI